MSHFLTSKIHLLCAQFSPLFISLSRSLRCPSGFCVWSLAPKSPLIVLNVQRGTNKYTKGTHIMLSPVSWHNIHHGAINSVNSLILLWLQIQAQSCQPEVARVISQVIISCGLAHHHSLQPPVQMGPNNSFQLACLTICLTDCLSDCQPKQVWTEGS